MADRRRSASLRSLAMLVCLGVCWTSAETALSQERSTFKVAGRSFLSSFRPVVDKAHYAVARIERFDKHDEVWVDASLGAVVDPSGIVLTKASELFGELRASLALHRSLSVEVVATDTRHDLALIRVGNDDEAQNDTFRPVTWAEATPDVGRWAVTPDTSRSPVAVGVVSVGPRVIDRSDAPGVLGIIMDTNASGYPTIESVYRDGAADRAGLLAGDRIYQVNRVDVPNRQTLVRTISQMSPGDRVSVRIRRGSEMIDYVAQLQHVPPLGDDMTDRWNSEVYRSRWTMMNELGSTLSVRRDNFPSAVQHDTVLNPSDCGGPVLNLRGEVVGINIARSGRTESLMIPVSIARTAVAEMLKQVPTVDPKQWTSTSSGP